MPVKSQEDKKRVTCEGCHSLLGFEEAENQSTVVKYLKKKSNELEMERFRCEFWSLTW